MFKAKDNRENYKKESPEYISEIESVLLETERLEAAAELEPNNGRNDIFVVDDDPSVRAAVSEMLRDGGFSVVSCESPELCLNLLKTSDCDIVLTDIRM